MKKYLLTVAGTVLFTCNIFAQHSVQTELTANGLLSSAKIETTDDGGFIVASSYTGSISAIMLTKFNSSGKIEWSRAYGDGLYIYNNPSLVVCNDGGYAVTGLSRTGINGSVYVAKFTAAGDLVWQKRFNYTVKGFASMQAYDITEAADKSLLLTGTSNASDIGDVFVLNLNSSTGAVNWFRTTGRHFYNETAYSIHTTPDKGFVVGGITGSPGSTDNSYLILKYNNRGKLEWSKTMRGRFSARNNDLFSIVPDGNGGYVFTGDAYNEGFDYDPVLVNLDLNRHIGWAWTINKQGLNYAKTVIRLFHGNGNYILLGSNNGASAYLARFASNGNFVSAGEDDGEGGFAYYTSAVPTPGHHDYLATNLSNSKIIISRFDDNSRNCGVTDIPDTATPFIVDTFATTYKLQDVTASLQSLDIQLSEITVSTQLSFLCRAQQDGLQTSAITASVTLTNTRGVNLYPNPAGSYITLSLNGIKSKTTLVYITDIQGRVVATFDFDTGKPGIFTKTINIATLQPGTYILTATDGKTKTITKFIRQAAN